MSVLTRAKLQIKSRIAKQSSQNNWLNVCVNLLIQESQQPQRNLIVASDFRVVASIDDVRCIPYLIVSQRITHAEFKFSINQIVGLVAVLIHLVVLP